MSIQECIFMAGSICFIFALIPSIFNPEGKPDSFTSAFTGLILTTFGVTYMTMEFYFAGAVTFVTAACWFILLAQVRYRNANPEFYEDNLSDLTMKGVQQHVRQETKAAFEEMDKNIKKKIEQDGKSGIR